jgi:AcrR family transcriptional regulator
MPKVVDSDERRAELAGAAARLIARQGLGAATMREVAAEAGWTTGVVMHYFPDKRQLLLHTFRASLEGRRARRAERADDPATALRQTLEGALPLDEERRRHWMVTMAFCAQASGDPQLGAAQGEAYQEFRRHVAGLVRAAGLASGRAAEPLAERLIAAADGVAVQALFDPAGWPPSRQRRSLDELLDAVLTRG